MFPNMRDSSEKVEMKAKSTTDKVNYTLHFTGHCISSMNTSSTKKQWGGGNIYILRMRLMFKSRGIPSALPPPHT